MKRKSDRPSNPNLQRYHDYLATPVEDWEARQRIGLSERDFDQLHDLYAEGQADWDLWHKVDIARKADALYLKEARAKGWTIAGLREQLSMETTREYRNGGEHVTETETNRCWPYVRHIHRIRKRSNKTIEELELAFPPEAESRGVLEKHWPGFEEESLLLCQKGHGDVAFLPPKNTTYMVVFSAGGSRKEFEFPVALRYKNLLRKFAELPLEDSAACGLAGRLSEEEDPTEEEEPTRGRDSSYELGEGMLGLWVTVLEYDPQKVKHIPGYIKKHLTWHMRDAYKKHSTTAGAAHRDPDDKRILKGRLERTGGEFDAPLELGDESDSDEGTLHEVIPDTKSINTEDVVFLNEVLAKIPDLRDRQIIYFRVCLDMTQKEVAELLDLTPSAVSQRMKTLQQIVRDILER